MSARLTAVLAALAASMATAACAAGGPLPAPADGDIWLGAGTHLVAARDVSFPEEPRFGGVSSMVMDGNDLLAISDRGASFRLGLRFAADGGVDAVSLKATQDVTGSDGKPLEGAAGDSESLTRDGDSWLLGYERNHRIDRYAVGADGLPGKWLQHLDIPEGVRSLPPNGGLESLTRLADGALVFIGEAPTGGSHLAWVGSPGNWHEFRYNGTGKAGLLAELWPTDARPLPDGSLLVLERRFSPLEGFGCRLVHLPAGWRAHAEAGEKLTGERVMEIARGALADNCEALAVRPSASGHGSDIFIMSDNNFMALQRTLLIQLRFLPERPAS